MRLLAAEPCSTPHCRTSQYRRTFIPSQYLSGTIWFTPYSMVWDWRVSRAGPMPFCRPSCFLLFYLQLFSLSLLFLYRLLVWGWGLQTDRVSISLSRPCIANDFNNNNSTVKKKINVQKYISYVHFTICSLLNKTRPNQILILS